MAFQNINKQPKSVDPVNLINSIFGEDFETLDTAKNLHKNNQMMGNEIYKNRLWRKRSQQPIRQLQRRS